MTLSTARLDQVEPGRIQTHHQIDILPGLKAGEDVKERWVIALSCVYDSTWEASDVFFLDDSDAVAAWVKNDHLGFEILYVDSGVVRKYRPDFLVRLKNGDLLVLETKGQDTEQDQVKRRYLDEWTQAVNAHGGFGRWRRAVAHRPGEIRDILMQNQEARAGS